LIRAYPSETENIATDFEGFKTREPLKYNVMKRALTRKNR